MFVALASPSGAWACATCFGAPGDAQTEGMNAAILTLVGVTAVVLSTLAVAGYAVGRRSGREGGGE